MNMGDIAATQQPVRRPNKLAHTMNEEKDEQMVNKKRGGNTMVMERAENVRG